MAEPAEVQRALLEWYAHQARDLPWRRTRDPYAILVAEVMLQQTQVERVIPKWHAWLERFPRLADLARATRADAIRAWQGLGYNGRAVRLHAIAAQAMLEFDGTLPPSIAELMRFKGIGRYTAGAVACFAFGLPVSMVDTNIRRVLSRVFGVAPETVESMADSLVPPRAAYAWNQALMDLGATLCRAQRPLCLVCPLVAQCGGPGISGEPRKSSGEAFAGSRRFIRGRILDELRALRPGQSLALSELSARVGGSAELVYALAADGLAEIDRDGRVQLVS